MNPHARGALRIAGLASLFAILRAAPALASKDPSSPAALSFHEGNRIVEIERAGAAVRADGEELTPVRLRFPGRTAQVSAFVDRTALVQMDPGAETELEALGARVVRPLMPSLGLYLVEDTSGGDGIDVARRLQPLGPRASGLRKAAPNLYFKRRAYGDFTPDDPRFPGQWYFKNLQMTKAWGLSLGDAGTTILVVDTGCDATHPDLKDKLDPGRDVVDGDDDPSPVVQENGAAHGTACAGLCAASTNNKEGMAGACPECRLRCVRLITDKSLPLSADVEAFQFAIDHDVAVVSNSWGFVDAMPVPAMLEDAINNVFDHGRGGKGALVVFAMGNDDREIGDDELEAVRGVLAIGAINNLDAATPFTNRGKCTDLVAPTGTLSTDITGKDGFDPGDYTTLFGGTSSACPVAAGIAGLLVSAAPDRTSAELYDILTKSARPAPYASPDENGHDLVFGYGIIDPVKALQTVLDTGTTGSTGGATSTSAATGGGGGTGGTGGGTGGAGPAMGGGCGCRASGGGMDWTSALYFLAALGVARARRRRA